MAHSRIMRISGGSLIRQSVGRDPGKVTTDRTDEKAGSGHVNGAGSRLVDVKASSAMKQGTD